MRVVSGEPLYWKARNLDIVQRQRVADRVRTRSDTRYAEEPCESDLPEDWARPAGVDERDRGVRSGACGRTDVIGAGTIIEIGANSSRACDPAFSPGTWDAPSGLRRDDSYTARGARPEPDAAQGSSARRSATAERQEGMRTLTVPFQPGAAGDPPRAGRVSAASRPVGEARVHFAPFGSMSRSSATYPRSRGQIGASTSTRSWSARSTQRTWELVAADASAAPTRPLDYIRTVDAYLHRPEFRYAERPPATPAGEAPLDYFINDVPPGLLPALRGRDGAAAADGRHPGARGDRLLARRLLGAQEGLDRPRHRRPRLGRGVVRPVRLGHRGPDARPPRPPAPRSPRSTAAAPAAAPSASDSGTAPPPRPTTARTRRPSARTCRLGTATAPIGGHRTTAAAWRWLLLARVIALGVGAGARASCCSSAARAAPPRWTGRSSRSRTRCGASGAPCRPARRCASSSAGSARTHPRSPRTCARCPSGRYAADFEPPSRDGRRALAAGAGARPRVRWAGARVVGDAAAGGARVAARRVADVGSRTRRCGRRGAQRRSAQARFVARASGGEHTVAAAGTRALDLARAWVVRRLFRECESFVAADRPSAWKT